MLVFPPAVHVLFAPVLAWNAGHGWISFVFQGGRALGTLGFRPETLLAALLGQAFYLFPWIWAALVAEPAFSRPSRSTSATAIAITR